MVYKEDAFVARVLESVRRTVEEADNFQGFVINAGISGGTGCGLGGAILSGISDYGKPRLTFGVLPSLDPAFPHDYSFEDESDAGGSNVKFTSQSVPITNPSLLGLAG